MTERDKVTVDDIIEIVKCEQTDSVEEVKKLRGRKNEKRFTIFGEWNKDYVIDEIRDTGEYVTIGRVVDLLNENEQLKADKQSLIDFIRKEFPKSHKHILEGFE